LFNKEIIWDLVKWAVKTHKVNLNKKILSILLIMKIYLLGKIQAHQMMLNFKLDKLTQLINIKIWLRGIWSHY
jgi:hypothetical protein